jgi:hypothetical protein
MAQYAVFLYSPAPADPIDTPPEEVEAHNRYGTQVEDLGGKILSGYALQPSTSAVSVRGDVVTDGPFVESKEVLAGFFILEAADLDQAREIGKLCPATARGGVEVRPLFELPAE